MTVRIKLPGGTLKMKVYRELRERERARRIPVLKMGSLYFTWWSSRQRPFSQRTCLSAVDSSAREVL
ncbi:hypothetical protein [Mesorhizobium sp.]|uniref:hypothetical protein n=1 Tax=Mesorhizobium sp. TaxID=1871066 RepID=UPI000FD1DC88|nr:hypothetical protein [Mesorhizobium sp.]RUU48729.1 hypothetical protein EOD08_01305 [Mesorhizobium sp. M6A.T.Ca.TU.002.02.2.1]RWP45637.1 MAG: hypothetical protein EOR06_30890 [Mesorhizobium sp.]RWP67709.1 MAG: hypothetical protein EOR09_32230 [Mesorhizobium sp.]